MLYGTQYFKREFGKTSAEYMLPDCFGFPASLPSILAPRRHQGLLDAEAVGELAAGRRRLAGPNSPEKTPDGIPFNVGVWEGPDGTDDRRRAQSRQLQPVGDLRPEQDAAASARRRRPDRSSRRRPLVDWPARIALNGQVTGVFTDYMYYGTGDTGGSPDRGRRCELMEAIADEGTHRAAAPVRPDAAAARRRPSRGTSAAAASERETQVGDGPRARRVGDRRADVPATSSPSSGRGCRATRATWN